MNAYDDGEFKFVALPPFRRKIVERDFSLLLAAVAGGDKSPQQLARAIGFDSSLAVSAISASLSDVEKTPDSIAVWRRAAYRLAANRDRIAKGWPCPPGDVAVGAYAASRIIGLEAITDAGGSRSFWRVSHRVLTGRSAGTQIIDRISPKAVYPVFRTLVGSPRKCSPFSPTMLAGMEAAVRLNREMGQIKITAIGVSRSQRSRNAKLTRQRFRVHAPCPFGFGVDCVDCVIGQSECGRSVHFIDTNFLNSTDARQQPIRRSATDGKIRSS